MATLKARRQIADLRPSATDSVHFASGNAVILVESAILPVVKVAAANADSILQATAGSAVALLRGTKFTVVTDTSRQHAIGHFANVAFHPARGGSINRFTPVDASKIANELLMFATNALLDRRTPFSAWRRGPFVLNRDDAAGSINWGETRLEMVSSISFVDHRCYDGDLTACAIGLGLRDAGDDATTRFDSAGRRELVRRNEAGLRRVHLTMTQSCIDGHDADCVALLHLAPAYAERPTLVAARRSLTKQALAMGGNRAAERMLGSEASPSDVLAAGAGTSIDSLLHTWHRNVREQDIKSQSLTIHLALVALGWVILLAAFATRSSRWR
jgi:hypothetical protein